MAIQTEPTRIQIPFADSGTKNVIPDTNSTPSASQAASWTDGFPAQCSLPLSAGGIPPARADFNGIFNTMTQSERFTQEGGVWAWDATVDYGTSRVVLGSDGLLYWSIAQSGPNLGGAQDPTADSLHAYWVSPKVPTMPAADTSSAVASTDWVNQWNSQNTVPSALYVDSVNGDNANSGTSPAAAKKTVAGALSVINDKSKTVGESVHIYLAPGTYSENLTQSSRTTISYHGDVGVVVQTITCSGANVISLFGTFVLTGSLLAHAYGVIVLSDGCTVKWQNVSSTYAISAYVFGTIRIYSGSSVSFAFTNCTFSSATVYCYSYGCMYFGGTETWSGTVSGKRYNLINSSQAIGIGSPTAIPGTTAGTADSLSVYN